MSDVFNVAGFCPRCDYAIDQICIKTMRLDSPCPRCKEAKVFDFYVFGTEMHRQRRRLWELGEVSGNPLPFPDNSGEEWKDTTPPAT